MKGFTALLILALPSAMVAQGGADAKARAALAPLMKLVGQSDGEARVSLLPGQTQVVRQHYDVTTGAGGTTLNWKGTGRVKTAAGKDSTVFQASATIFYDNAVSKLRVRAKLAQGDSVLADVEQRPDTLIYGFPLQGARIRFTIAYSNTDWHEVGQLIMPNGNAIPTAEMRLKKAK